MRLLARTITRSIMAGALLVGAPALVPPAATQVVISPATVEVSLPAGQQGEALLVVTNEGQSTVDLSAVPLPEGPIPEEPPGTLLFWRGLEVNGNPFALAMTSGGRLFVTRYGGG